MATSRVGASDPSVGTSSNPAARMIGVASRNENRAASSWRSPATSPAAMVIPEARDPRQERARLEEADDHGGAQAQAVDALVGGIVLLVSQHRRAADGPAALVAAPEHLGREEDPAVDDQEYRRGSGIAEQRLQRVLQEEADDPGGDGADDQHDRQTLIGIVDATRSPRRRKNPTTIRAQSRR